ncbi:MAG: hypothetical protein NTZ05_05045 [Chloroflexi bacterium]|nr:hypothetical protein [Chloroflexota bacterium]
MNWYRLRLTVRGPVGSPWQADTLWGHLCWAMRFAYGEGSLADFIDRYRQGPPPLLLSTGFPDGWLPRPLHAQPTMAESDGEVGSERARFRAGQRAKSIDLVTEEDFGSIVRGEVWAPNDAALESPRSPTRVSLKNQISRTTGTTGDGGELFGFVEHWQPRAAPAPGQKYGEPLPVVVYCKIEADYVDPFELLLWELTATGYGKRRSVGYGAIQSATLEEFNGFPAPPNANAFVSLSNFVPAAGDPTDGMWRAFIKYGKLGEDRAAPPDDAPDAPFKRPLIMLQAGAVFRDTPVKPFYGRLVNDMSRRYPDVVQYGYALPVPLVWSAAADPAPAPGVVRP